MTDSENSQPQDGSDEDIYQDFAEFNFENEVAKLESSKEVYKQEAHDLSERVKKLIKENEELKKLNEVLKKNLSTLLKTAQAEVQRKDLVISELRSKIDSFTFRRHKTSVKDKCTNTEDLPNPVDNKIEIKKSEPCISRYSGESKRKTQERESGRSETNTVKSNSPVCDIKKLGYEDRTKHSFNSDNNNEFYKERFRGSQPYRHREKERIESKRSFRYNYRDHLKYDSMDKKRHPDERRYSFRSRERRWEWRDDSPDRRRRRESRKDKSHSQERSSRSRNSSEFRTSREELGFKEKERGEHKVRDSELTKIETDNRRSSRNRGESSEKGGRSQRDSNTSGDDQKKNSKRQYDPNMFDTKSPLDALYSEPVVSRGFGRVSAPKDDSFKDDICSETDFEEEKPENEFEELRQEDWMLSFKNERQKDTKPMTLYSKRMMQKLACLENQRLKNEEASKEVTSKPEQNTSVEKEPGELTDDENIVESSKEFQELAQLAFIESKTTEELKNEDNNRNTKTDSFKEPMKVPSSTSNEKIAQKANSENDSEKEESALQKGTGDVIEFSPFKNNYKLIEISLTKPQEIRKNLHARGFPGDTQLQKEVESSIFDLLSTMSGVPIERNDKIDKEEMIKTDVKQTKKEDAVKEKSEVRKEGRITRSKTPKPKKSKDVSQKEKKCAEKKEKVSAKKSEDLEKKEVKPVEEVTPGETTQFLDFFLLTTSPSKPIMPKEIEKETEAQKPDPILENPESVDKTEKLKPVEEKKKSEEALKNSSLEKQIDKAETKKEVSKKSPKPKKRVPIKTISTKPIKDDKNKKRSRKESEEEPAAKKPKVGKTRSPRRRTRSERDSKSESQSTSGAEKTNEDISFFEFFKPITKTGEEGNGGVSTDYKMTRTMSVTGVVCLETPNKCVEKYKNVTINEQMVCQVVDSEAVPISPLVGSKFVEMTPRRMLKNDLMLTDSEDDSVVKSTQKKQKESREEEEEVEEDEEESFGSENSERDSDSGASDLVDLL